MRRSSLWNIFMILQNLFTKIAKTAARAAATVLCCQLKDRLLDDGATTLSESLRKMNLPQRHERMTCPENLG